MLASLMRLTHFGLTLFPQIRFLVASPPDPSPNHYPFLCDLSTKLPTVTSTFSSLLSGRRALAFTPPKKSVWATFFRVLPRHALHSRRSHILDYSIFLLSTVWPAEALPNYTDASVHARCVAALNSLSQGKRREERGTRK